jgi:hypothetical protein
MVVTLSFAASQAVRRTRLNVFSLLMEVEGPSLLEAAFQGALLNFQQNYLRAGCDPS